MLLPNPTLLIENLDRFSRDTLDNADTEFWGLIKRGVDVLVLSMGGEPFTKGDENDSIKRALVMFEFDRAHRESERKSDLITSVMASKVNDASNGLKVCLGNWVPKWVTFKGEFKQPGVYAPNKKWETADWIVKSYLAGMSTNAIAKELKRNKTPLMSSHGKRWTQGNVRHILGSEALLGQVTVKGQTFRNHFPRLVNQEQWNILQERLRQNRVRKGGLSKGQRVANLFANRVKCVNQTDNVNHTVTVITMDKGRRRYFQCKEARFHGNCSRRMLKVQDVEEDFFSLFLQEQPSALLGKHNHEHSSKVAEIQSRIVINERAIDKLAKAVAQTNNLPQVVRELNQEKAKRDKAAAELEEANRAMLKATNAPTAFENIKKALFAVRTSKSGSDKEATATIDFDRAVKQLEKQLKDDAIRKQLRDMLPALVQRLEMDLEKGAYRVITASGEGSKWRQVVF